LPALTKKPYVDAIWERVGIFLRTPAMAESTLNVCWAFPKELQPK